MKTWQIDTAHTTVSFTAKHMMITKTRGLFKGTTGTIEYDEVNPAASSVSVEIPAATIDTGMEPRDNHLRSADFFDVENHPTISFRSTGIEPKGDRWAISGDLTIRGVTRRVVLDTENLGVVTALDGRRHAGFEATTRIKRSEWGLTWNVGLEAGGWLVSDDVTIELEIAADELAATPAEAATAGATA